MTQKSRRPKRKDTEVPHPSGFTTNVADEAVNEEMDDSLERAATTATSLDAEQDSGNIDKTQSKATPNEPSSPRTSSGGGPRRQETMGDTIAQTRSENVSKTSNDPLLIRVESSDEEGLGEEDASKQGRIADIDANKDIYLVNVHTDEDMFGVNDLDTQSLATLKSAKPKADKVMLQEPEQGTITTTAATTVTVASTRPKAKGLVIQNYEQAPTQRFFYDIHHNSMFRIKLQAEEEEEEERLAKKKLNKLKKATLFHGIIEVRTEGSKTRAEGSSKRARDELKQESSKKKKLEEDKESEELKKCLEIVPDNGDDVTIDATLLSIKSPSIVDWKIHKEGKKSYYQIIRADGSSKMYLVFSHMLKSFDKDVLSPSVICSKALDTED
ncbi:hypothetical protein Tco_1114775 [Tanacetum coccineum]